jgi:hypothetical protein
MWLVKMMSGQEFKISESQSVVVKEAMKNKGLVDLGFAIINTSSVECLLNTKDYRSNPIVTDDDFVGWLEGNSAKLDLLNSRYDGNKYHDYWVQAREYKRLYEKGEIKLLN